MKPSHCLALSLLGLAIASGASAAPSWSNCINKDLINLGPTAYDVGVLITGNQPLTWRYDGEPGAVFSSFTAVMAGPNEFLHWRNLQGVDAPILTGDLVHIGWCTSTHQDIVDMWWTTKSGGRVPGSVIYESKVSYWSRSIGVGVEWNHRFNGANALVISDVRASISNTPWSLDQLNRQNTVLAEQLRPVPGGTSFQITPGGTAQLPLQEAVSGQWVVVSYHASAEGSTAATRDFVQFQIP